MIIKARFANTKGSVTTQYYCYTSRGEPHLGAKGQAAQFDEKTGAMVLRHLKVIDARFVNAELVN